MGGSVWRHLHWLPGSSRFRPDWRLRRAEYLLVTRSRLNRHIDDQLIRNARTDLAESLRRGPSISGRGTMIQSVQQLSRSDSPLRWRLEAYLLTDLPNREIGEILHLSSEFIAIYHDLAFEVRPRRRATDWLTCHAMSRERRLNLEYAWKTIARSGGPKVLEVAIAITTGSPFPVWMQQTFKNPRLDDAILRMRGKLLIGAMLAQTREQWRALVALRRKLRRVVPSATSDKGEARLQVMLSLLTGANSNGSVLDENLPIRAPEPFTPATTPPGDCSSQPPTSPSVSPPSVPAAVSDHGRRKSRGTHQQHDPAATEDGEELPHDVVEFMTDDLEGTGPLAYVHVEIEESKWSAFEHESETQTVPVSVRV